GWPLVAAIAVAFVSLVPRATEMPGKTWPVAAVQFVKQHPEQFGGKVLNDGLWGSYFLLSMPEHKVFVDGRLDFFGESLFKDMDDLEHLGPGWQETLSRYEIDWTFLPTKHPINVALALVPHWKLAYSDELATIYRRVR